LSAHLTEQVMFILYCIVEKSECVSFSFTYQSLKLTDWCVKVRQINGKYW